MGKQTSSTPSVKKSIHSLTLTSLVCPRRHGSFRSLVEELGCVLCACIHEFGGGYCVVEGGREDGSEYAMEVGLRETWRHRGGGSS